MHFFHTTFHNLYLLISGLVSWLYCEAFDKGVSVCSGWSVSILAQSRSYYSCTLVLVGPRTHQTLDSSHSDKKKSVSAPGACSGLVTLARTCVSHGHPARGNALSVLACSVLEGFGTHHKFWNELMMSVKVPLYRIN